jgi:type IV pilus assembly protein PilX
MKQPTAKKAQQGIALIVVMIILMIMLIGAMGILRNTNVGLGIAGNLGFKQNATSVSDQGVEAARAWLIAQDPLTLYLTPVASDSVAYFATMTPGFNPDTYVWTTKGNSVISTANDGTGNQVRYVIHRMCLREGSPSFRALPGPPASAAQECVHPTVNQSGSRQLGGAGVGIKAPVTPLYRVTVRTDGPRNTMSQIQVMIY